LKLIVSKRGAVSYLIDLQETQSHCISKTCSEILVKVYKSKLQVKINLIDGNAGKFFNHQVYIQIADNLHPDDRDDSDED